MTTRERVEKVVLAAFSADFEPHPTDVAMELVDQDVAAGEYEGCSSELEMAYTEYVAAAERVLA